MIFPITDLLSESESLDWIEQHFHPHGLTCPGCGAGREQARVFRQAKRGPVDYRCRRCDTPYHLYTETVFERRSLSPRPVGLLLRGVGKGESTQTLAEEFKGSRTTAQALRQKLQAHGSRRQPRSPLSDAVPETDERCQNAGEKRSAPWRPPRPAAPPRPPKAGARHR